jgi:hypothetical protein
MSSGKEAPIGRIRTKKVVPDETGARRSCSPYEVEKQLFFNVVQCTIRHLKLLSLLYLSLAQTG